MAAIPTYIYLGDGFLNGPGGTTVGAAGAEYLANLIPGLAPGAGGFTDGLLDDRLLSDVPNNTGSSQAPVHAYRPWWDGSAGDQVVVPTGSYGGTSITFAGAAWTVDEHVGKKFYVDSHPGGGSNFGPSFGSHFTISANTADTLTLSAGTSKEGIPGATLTDNGQSILVHIAEGRWVRYQHVANRAVSSTQGPLAQGAGLLGTNGDAWYQDGNPGSWSSSINTMQLLESMHGSAPGFRFFKLAFAAGWRGMNGGPQWDKFVAEYDKSIADSSFGDPGDTTDLRGIILDFSHHVFSIPDPVLQSSEITGYVVDMLGTVAQLQAKFGVAVPIYVVQPSSTFRPDAPGAFYDTLIADLRYANKVVSDTQSNRVSLVDMNFATVQLDESTGLYNQYRSVDILEQGERLYRAILAGTEATVAVAPGAAISTFLWFGDSQMVGQVLFTFVLNTMSPRLLGPHWQSGGSSSSVRPGQYVYNGDSKLIEQYDIQSNENTNPSASTQFFGPTCSGIATLGAKFEESLSVKVAAGGSMVTEEGRQYFISQGVVDRMTWDPLTTGQYSLFEAAQVTMADLFSRTYDLKQRTPDVRGAFLILGDNDTFVEASSSVMERKYGDLLTKLEQNFYTRASGNMQFVVVLPPRHVDNGGASEHGTAEHRAIVRAAITAVVASRDNVQLIDGDNYELQNEGASDKSIHYAGPALLNLGDDMSELMISMLGSAADGPTVVVQSAADAVVGGEAVEAPASGSSPSVVAAGAVDGADVEGQDYAAFTTATGLSVTMKSEADIELRRRNARAEAMRKRGLRQTRVDFSRRR